MASDISKIVNNATESCANEIEKDADKKIKIALNKTMQRVEKKVDEIIEEYMVEAYYNGYSPIEYIRSRQLGKSAKSYTDLFTSGSTMGFNFGVEFDEKKMNHSTYKIKARWYRKRKKEWAEQTYTVKSKNYNNAKELAILDAFQNGIHPNAVLAGATSTPNGSPMWINDSNDEPYGCVPAIVEAWVDDGGIRDIFLEELNKLY